MFRVLGGPVRPAMSAGAWVCLHPVTVPAIPSFLGMRLRGQAPPQPQRRDPQRPLTFKAVLSDQKIAKRGSPRGTFLITSHTAEAPSSHCKKCSQVQTAPPRDLRRPAPPRWRPSSSPPSYSGLSLGGAGQRDLAAGPTVGMEAAPARDLTRHRQELLAPPCLDSESLRKGRPPAREPGALRCLTPNGRCVGRDSSTAHPN